MTNNYGKHIFIVNGHPGSGKTTFGKILNKFIPCEHISVIDPIKDEAERLGWDSEYKTEKDRKFLSDLKDICSGYNDYPFQELTKKLISFLRYSDKTVLLIDIREPEEINRAVELFGAESICIDRPGCEKVTTNHADANVDKCVYDQVVRNPGTLDDFYAEIEKFAKFNIGLWVKARSKKSNWKEEYDGYLDKRNQIDEMTRILANETIVIDPDPIKMKYMNANKIAEALYSAGYRKEECHD